VNAAAALRFEPAGEGAWAAAGALTFATARAARLAGLGALQGVPQGLRIDCAGVTSADSAGLAVLLDWLAAAQLAGRHLKFTGLPPGLTALATISEVSELLARGV
jgi:phospholipid transport system transporter-binding protein